MDNEVRKTCVVGGGGGGIREDDSVFRLDAEAEGISRTRATLPFRVSSDGGGGL